MIGATLLATILIVALLAHAMFRSASSRPKRSRSLRYVQTMVEILVLLCGLLAVAVQERISIADLGLAWPLPNAGWLGLAFAFTLIIVLSTMVLMAKPTSPSQSEQDAMADMPQSNREAWLFGALAPVLGFGWEILYRAYLLWYLTPLVGLIAAIVIASVSYGLAHGVKSRTRVMGSVVTAFLFTFGFAATRSLWWLVAIHTALPLIGVMAARRRQFAASASAGKAVPL